MSALACAAALTAHAAPVGATEAPPRAAADARSVLMGVTVDGVTAYPLAELAPLYADQLTREVGMADLVRIAQAITDKYRKDGYFLARAVVPPQEGPPGLVRLRVYEGHISQVRVAGEAAPPVRRLLADVTAQKPLKLSELDRRLTLAADLPGLKLKSELEPDLEDPARHTLMVRADVRRLNASLYADNRGSESAGPWQVYGRAGVNSAVLAGDQLALAVLTTPEDWREFSHGELSYALPLATGGTFRAAVSAAEARDASSHFGGLVGNLNRAMSLRVSHPISRGRRHSVWGAAELNASHVEQDRIGGGGYADDLRVLRASVFADRQAPGRSLTGFLQVSGGLDALGASDRAGLGRSRSDADGQFWKVNGHLSHYRDLGRIAGVYASADGQWTEDALPASEEFAAGGLPYGRAYNYGEISGDRGAGALIELRVGWDPKLKPLTFFQTYVFADTAHVWRLNAQPGWKEAHLASAGAGVRLTLSRRATLRIEAARPLTRVPYETGDRGWRGFVALNAAF